MLSAKGQLALQTALSDWLPTAAAPEAICLLPLDIEVVLALERLPADFHGDPADRIIVATALANDLPLVTRDGNIRRSGIVTMWNP